MPPPRTTSSMRRVTSKSSASVARSNCCASRTWWSFMIRGQDILTPAARSTPDCSATQACLAVCRYLRQEIQDEDFRDAGECNACLVRGGRTVGGPEDVARSNGRSRGGVDGSNFGGARWPESQIKPAGRPEPIRSARRLERPPASAGGTSRFDRVQPDSGLAPAAKPLASKDNSRACARIQPARILQRQEPLAGVIQAASASWNEGYGGA